MVSTTIQRNWCCEAADLGFAQRRLWGIARGRCSYVAGLRTSEVLEVAGQGFEAGRKIYGFAYYGIFEAIGRAYVARGDLAGVDADADF